MKTKKKEILKRLAQARVELKKGDNEAVNDILIDLNIKILILDGYCNLFLGILYNTYMKDYEDALLLALVILLILQILYYEKWKKNKIK